MAVLGRNSTPIALMMLIAVWVSPQSAVASDYLYGSIAGWGNLIDPDADCTFSVSRDGVDEGQPDESGRCLGDKECFRTDLTMLNSSSGMLL